MGSDSAHLKSLKHGTAVLALLAGALAPAGAVELKVSRDAMERTLKQQLFIHAPGVGYLFERKEHLAFGVSFHVRYGGRSLRVSETVSIEGGSPAPRRALKPPLERTDVVQPVSFAVMVSLAAELGLVAAIILLRSHPSHSSHSSHNSQSSHPCSSMKLGST